MRTKKNEVVTMPDTPLNPDAFDLACKELFLTITAHKSAADVLGFDWKSLKASTRKPWETATRKVLTAYLEADGTAEELHEINTRLARILTDTADALKGEPDPLTSHSWHDLAEVAKRAVDGLKEQTDVQSVDNYLAVAQPEVTTQEELDKLPHETVIRDNRDFVFERIAQHGNDPEWWSTTDFLNETKVTLPARVLFRPEV